jgi:ATP-dependent DNA ligase
MELYKDKLVAKHGYFEGAASAVDAASSAKAIDYKKTVTKSYQSLSPEQVESRLSGTDFYVTKKYDGELNLIYFDSVNVFLLNRSGRVRLGLPCVEAAGKALAAANIKQAIIPSELYVDETSGRTRVFDVLEALANEQMIKNLRLAPFDIYELDDTLYRSRSYEETYRKLTDIFGKTETSQAVKMERASSKQAVLEIYNRWVEEENAEGLVVRSELPLVHKIKPRHTIDVAVIGFSEGTGDQKGMIRSLLLAMMTEDGKFQIIGRTGNGFDDELKKKLLDDFSPKIIESSYIETDSNHVAFHMVQPDTVIELMVNDVLFETSSGAILNQVLELENNRWFRSGNVDGVSFVYPIFVRFRDDKTVCVSDVRLSQINSFSVVPQDTGTEDKKLSESKLLAREVYKKVSGEKLMVQKFLVWATGKENDPDYPAFVFHYTNFSSDRKEPLQRDVFISNEQEQILQLMTDSIAENVKKGWEKV